MESPYWDEILQQFAFNGNQARSIIVIDFLVAMKFVDWHDFVKHPVHPTQWKGGISVACDSHQAAVAYSGAGKLETKKLEFISCVRSGKRRRVVDRCAGELQAVMHDSCCL